MDQLIEDCIEICKTCALQCHACATQCKVMGGMENGTESGEMCAAACEKHAKLLAEGDHSAAMECIAACEANANEAENVFRHLGSCLTSAETCRKCAEFCRQIEDMRTSQMS